MKALYQSMLAVAVLATASLALADEPIWTETFDDGVGLLDQTRGNGDSVFFWDGDTQSIDGTFIRYPVPIHANDRRFAFLGGTFDFHDTVLGFTTVVTPLSATATNVGALIGFVNSQVDPENDMMTVQFKGSGLVTVRVEGHSGSCGPCELPFNFGTTYFVEVLLNGPELLFSASFYEGTDSSGSFVGNVVKFLSPDWDIHLDSLGFTNVSAWSTELSFHALIHEISYSLECVPSDPGIDLNQNGIPDECECLADISGDGDVGPLDLAILLGAWGPCAEPPTSCPADISGVGDGIVGADDLAFLLGSWGSCQ